MMQKRKLSATAFFLALGILAAPAQAEEELAPGFDACMERSGGVTSSMNECLTKANDYWEKKLAANYRRTMKQDCQELSGNPDECRAKVKAAEIAWIKYKEAMVQALYEVSGGGTAAGVAANDFIVQQTKNQAKLWGDGE